MGQRLLLIAGGILVVFAIGIGAIGLTQAQRTPAAAGVSVMHGRGPGGMMGYGPGGMMGGYPRSLPAGTQVISIDQAQRNVEQYIAAYGGSNLVLDELIEFQDNFYAIVKEKSTGTGAFELLVDRVTGTVAPEPGPDMMWNTRYGMMAGGMMGAFRPSGTMTVTGDRAAEIAQAWLDANVPGARTETPDQFYGYYTVHFTQNGQVAGMLSVNGYSGQVWFHSWHGAFIQQREVGA